MQNKKFKKIHPVASQKLVEEFDPQLDKVDKFILDHVLGKRPFKVKQPSPNTRA